MQTDYSVELQICVGELSCLFAIILVSLQDFKIIFSHNYWFIYLFCNITMTGEFVYTASKEE